MDLEKGAGTLDNMSMTGWQSRSGEPITFRLRGMDPTPGLMPDVAFIHLCHDAIITVGKAQVDIAM